MSVALEGTPALDPETSHPADDFLAAVRSYAAGVATMERAVTDNVPGTARWNGPRTYLAKVTDQATISTIREHPDAVLHWLMQKRPDAIVSNYALIRTLADGGNSRAGEQADRLADVMRPVVGNVGIVAIDVAVREGRDKGATVNPAMAPTSVFDRIERVDLTAASLSTQQVRENQARHTALTAGR